MSNPNIDFRNGCWWGLIRNDELIEVKLSNIHKPAPCDFNRCLNSIDIYQVIPVVIKKET
jgi:hypothetical protein